ncbi:hypothetical protein BS47DRAFT_1395989 [Hydnum rufescens UP504]|uniref:Uncharacterized protein n=1 Tax=Hydnum rufescens UP504 TaxID=1448309 RepID=A0A9P6AR22_9AGAM|nr:hypothetical protein BS47DRAFT_1395989 [Hydnum rufescens UP504]
MTYIYRSSLSPDGVLTNSGLYTESIRKHFIPCISQYMKYFEVGDFSDNAYFRAILHIAVPLVSFRDELEELIRVDVDILSVLVGVFRRERHLTPETWRDFELLLFQFCRQNPVSRKYFLKSDALLHSKQSIPSWCAVSPYSVRERYHISRPINFLWYSNPTGQILRIVVSSPASHPVVCLTSAIAFRDSHDGMIYVVIGIFLSAIDHNKGENLLEGPILSYLGQSLNHPFSPSSLHQCGKIFLSLCSLGDHAKRKIIESGALPGLCRLGHRDSYDGVNYDEEERMRFVNALADMVHLGPPYAAVIASAQRQYGRKSKVQTFHVPRRTIWERTRAIASFTRFRSTSDRPPLSRPRHYRRYPHPNEKTSIMQTWIQRQAASKTLRHSLLMTGLLIQDQQSRYLVISCPHLYIATAIPEPSMNRQTRISSGPPLSPLIPLVASVQYWSPSFDLSTVDIVTDRSNLTKLVNWIMNSHFYKDFRIDLDVSGRRTVLFTRWEGSAHYPMGNGYTETFKWVTTVSDRSRNGRFGHLRMVTYDFAGLKLLVRHEVDACLPTESDVKAMPRTSASGEDSPATVDHPHLTLIRRGVELISQSRLVEVKTRSLGALRAVNWSEIYSRLYLSQTPHTYFGIHDRGLFVRIERKALDASDRDMVLASQDAEYGLRRLGSVLYALRESVLEARGDHALAVLCRGGKLALYKRTSNGLPEELIHAFD